MRHIDLHTREESFISLFFLLTSLIFLSDLHAEVPLKHLYLGNDTHTDLMWNGDEDDWYRYTLDMAKFYLNIGESTEGSAPEARSKWNYDVAWNIYMLEKRAPKDLFDRLVRQLRNGQASVPYNFVSAVYGASGLESTLRSFYYGGYLERTYGIPMVLAVSQENATLPLGLASLWAGSGAKYSWKGVCNCATKINTVGDRDHEVYWYTGLDGSRVLMKWYSNYGWNAELGGYAEMLEPTVAVQQMNALCGSERYPYHIAGAFGKGWDSIHNYAYDLVWALGHRTLPGTKLHLSNQIDFFEHFESEYGNELAEVSLAHGNEWDLNLASLAEVNAGLRRSMEKLRTAEAMAAVVSGSDPDLFESLESAKEDFYYALGVFNVHGWTADGPIDRHEFATYMRGQQARVRQYVNALHNLALLELGRKINAGDLEHVYFIYNALSWDRDALVDIQLESDFTGVLDLESGKIYEGISIQKDGQRFLRARIREIPSAGYRLIQCVREKKASTPVLSPFHFSGQTLETPYYRVKLTKSGAIRSLFDKTTGIQWAGGLLHDLGGDADRGEEIHILHREKDYITLICRSDQPVQHESKITFYSETPRIDFEDRISENFSGLLHWSFDFEVDDPEVWHEEVGAVIKAKTVSAGGHYADRMARYDYLSLNHFLNVGDSKRSITLSNRDCLFFRLGESKPDFLDGDASCVHVLVGGQVNENLGVIAQDGDSLFHQNFSLMPHHFAFDAAKSMKFALEHQNPVVTGTVHPGGDWFHKQVSFLKTDNPDVLLWTHKPAEQEGIIARVWNLALSPVSTRITFNNYLTEACLATHVETDIEAIPVNGNTLFFDLKQQQLKTFRVIAASENEKNP